MIPNINVSLNADMLSQYEDFNDEMRHYRTNCREAQLKTFGGTYDFENTYIVHRDDWGELSTVKPDHVPFISKEELHNKNYCIVITLSYIDNQNYTHYALFPYNALLCDNLGSMYSPAKSNS